MRPVVTTVALTALLVPSAASLAQMRPGAKVEKTYGLGLPRDMDKLVVDDREYPEYPLKPGQEAYRDVEGYRIKELIKYLHLNELSEFGDRREFSNWPCLSLSFFKWP
jgi:hypothetical protein